MPWPTTVVNKYVPYFTEFKIQGGAGNVAALWKSVKNRIYLFSTKSLRNIVATGLVNL